MSFVRPAQNFLYSLWVQYPEARFGLIAKVRGARASRVLLSASRRERFGWFGRDAQTDTRLACAPGPRNTDNSFCNAAGPAPRIFTLNALASQQQNDNKDNRNETDPASTNPDRSGKNWEK